MAAPNYLDNLHISSLGKKASCGWLVAMVFGAIFFLFFWQWMPWVAVAFLIVALIVFFTFHLEWGLYLLAGTSFFIGWEILFSTYPWARDIPYLSSVNAPLVDLVAIFLLCSIAVAWLLHIRPYRFHHLVQALPGFWWYGAFLLTGIVSLFGAYNHEILLSLKYFFRAMIFSYVAFVFVPVSIINRPETLFRVLKLWTVVGAGIALFGISSIFVVPQSGWVRFLPYGIHGFAPLQYNHNVLAEPLIVLLPLVGYILMAQKNHVRKIILSGVFFLMLGVALGTLSRAAWLSIIIQAVGAAFFFRVRVREFFRFRPIFTALFSLVLVPVVGYMVFFLGSSIVASSTESRSAAIQVAAFYIARAPLLGYGPGMYQSILGDTLAYRLDYGDPLDSHGFVQKILLEEGMIGFLCFAAFLGWVLWSLWRAQRDAKTVSPLFQAFFLMILGIIVFELFNTSYFNSVMWLPIGVALAAVKLGEKRLASTAVSESDL